MPPPVLILGMDVRGAAGKNDSANQNRRSSNGKAVVDNQRESPWKSDASGDQRRSGDRRERHEARPVRRRVDRRRQLRGRSRWHRPGVRQAAQSRLQRFRQASALAVALTAMLLFIWEMPTTAGQDSAAPAEAPAGDVVPSDPGQPALDAEASLDEATTTVRDLFEAFIGLMPKIVIALLLIVLAFLASRLVRRVLHRFSHRWEKTDAVSALVRIGLVLLAIGAGLSVIAGDARALVGSVGLIGLALSWALQTPIESFTGWVLNAFRSYYRPGDRIEVGDVYGDVYRIDVLTTTVWQVGGPGKPVAASQSTGALVTFPNWEVLRSNIVNYSRDFPYVWDEVTIGVTNESDLRYAIEVFRRVAAETLGEAMKEPAERYREMLQRERLAFDVEPHPEVYLSASDAWTNCTIRYLVPVRQRRKWSTRLLLALSVEMSKPEHAGRIAGSYPHTIVDLRRSEQT